MKTTLDIPDAILRRAKAKAAQDRIPLRQFVTEAVAEKLETKSCGWQKARLAVGWKGAPLTPRDRPHQRLD